MTGGSYELVIVALKDATPADVRLQALLKTALRRFAFRCKSVRPVEVEKKRTTKARKKKSVDRAVHSRGAAARMHPAFD